MINEKYLITQEKYKLNEKLLSLEEKLKAGDGSENPSDRSRALLFSPPERQIPLAHHPPRHRPGAARPLADTWRCAD